MTAIADYTDESGHEWDSGKAVVSPTCSGAGMMEYHCVRCDQMRLETLSEEGHTPGEAAACTAPQVCTVCGVVLAQAAGHNFEAAVTPAACLTMGYTTHACTNCDVSYQKDYKEPLGHNYIAEVTAPECLVKGYTTYTCERCGDSYLTDYTNELGHEWDEGTPVVNPTCNGAGMLDHRCIRCDYHYLESLSEEGHTPGAPATCTEPQICEMCGAVLANATGHEYEAALTDPTCTEMGFTTYTCLHCADSYKNEYVDAAGHAIGEWIVDSEATTEAEGKRHKECTVCGERLEEETLQKLYLSATTDTRGEAVVGQYLVIVTDTNSNTPVENAAVSLLQDGKLSVRLPEGRLLDYAAQTTVTVQRKEDKSPAASLSISVTDTNANYSMSTTDENGRITVPLAEAGSVNSDGKLTLGYLDPDGNRWTLSVKVESDTTKQPIQNATVSIGTTGNITAALPDGSPLDENNRVTVTVTDHQKTPQNSKNVIVKGAGQTLQGQTNKDGKLTVPAFDSAYTDETGTALLGQYTVIVTDKMSQPVVKALVTLINRNDRDAFTVLLPDGRLLDANDQTTVTVLLMDGTPSPSVNIQVTDHNGNRASKYSDKQGKITVPDATSAVGNTIGTDNSKYDENGEISTDNTVNVDVKDEHGSTIQDTKINVSKDGNVAVTLPDGYVLSDGEVTVTVTDNYGNPKSSVSVSVRDSGGCSAAGQTDRNGQVTVPDVTHTAYIYGYTDGTIGPENHMTRSEAAAIFSRILADARGEDLNSVRHASFPDVSPGAWYYSDAAYLESLGVVHGYNDGNFHGEAAITRREFVTMCARLGDLMTLHTRTGSHSSFPDVTANDWAVSYIREAARSGWIEGFPDGNFHGGSLITRAEVVTIVNRMLGREPDKAFIRANADSLNQFSDLLDPHHWAFYDLAEAANTHSLVSGSASETWHTAE